MNSMAMSSFADAQAFNDLIHYLLGDDHDEKKAEDAAAHLAHVSYTKLQAGVTPETVRARWASRPLTGRRFTDGTPVPATVPADGADGTAAQVTA
ncbi:hypothetical protein [Saccharothrix sp. HUAS TT1]|uniref:hypothetical protein n=1 Tax=unclassified Saccharothrix TaxID=2593673 RepID=UPI00345C210F